MYTNLKKIIQTDHTNCLSACLATLLCKNIYNIPNFYIMSNSSNMCIFYANIFLLKYKLKLYYFSKNDNNLRYLKDVYWISYLHNKEDKAAHVVITHNGKVIHDPAWRKNYWIPYNKYLEGHYILHRVNNA